MKQRRFGYWLTPIRFDRLGKQELTRLEKDKVYFFGQKTPGRKSIRPGDWICFYASGLGIVAHAQVSSHLNEDPRAPDFEYRWRFDLENVCVYLDDPLKLDQHVRKKLKPFRGRDSNKWAWFVQSTRRLVREDFELLTGREKYPTSTSNATSIA